MAEERWHDFAKEIPSEDMEGRNFIVSNGHYEKIATWCGYWENEPFMGDRLCDEVVRWKFYFTPEEEKANEETCNELFVEEGYNGAKYYDKDAVDALLAKKDAEIARLESNNKTLKLWYVNAKNAMHETEEACEAKDKDVAYWRKEYDEETKFTDALKAEIESLKSSHYAEMVDAGMRERRLRRALWLARAERAKYRVEYWACRGGTLLEHYPFCVNGDSPFNRLSEMGCLYGDTNERLKEAKFKHLYASEWMLVWENVERKCREKAEEYK